jgi:hypothetical protein
MCRMITSWRALPGLDAVELATLNESTGTTPALQPSHSSAEAEANHYRDPAI